MPEVTIITTCFQASRCIDSTIKSVLSQTYRDFEYIIQDGGSTDDTFAIARSYEASFNKLGIPFHCYCKKDNGIYEGMNNAVEHSSGSFINFMNAGDTFIAPDVLDHIFCKNDSTGTDIIYGDAVEYEYGRYYYFPKNYENIKYAMPFSHQSVFARRELLCRFPFKTSYRIASDYDFLLTVSDLGCHFRDCGIPVCIITKDGLSTVDLYETFVETVSVQHAHGTDRFTEKQYVKKCRSAKIRQFGMKHFPEFIRLIIRRIQRYVRKQNTAVPASVIENRCL